MKEKILVTGGAGYVGSHIVVRLLNGGWRVVILDNLSNSHPAVVKRIQRVTGRTVDLVVGDIRDRLCLRRLFQEHSVRAVIHLAGLKSIRESELHPLRYYDHNLFGSAILFDEMINADVNIAVFSSSATVYGPTGCEKCKESATPAPINTYGKTKQMVEEVLKDLRRSNPKWQAAILRYFNCAGAHESGLIGENPLGEPNNLLPILTQVASRKRKRFSIFGSDYPTRDGTALRDYVHVEDLAEAHISALNGLLNGSPGWTINLGSGVTHTLFEVVRSFEKVSETKIPFEILDRRTGDLAECCADPTLARTLLSWEAKQNLDRICEDAWRWQKRNPWGYAHG